MTTPLQPPAWLVATGSSLPSLLTRQTKAGETGWGRVARVLQSPETATVQRTCLAGTGVPTLPSTRRPSSSPGSGAHSEATVSLAHLEGEQRTLGALQCGPCPWFTSVELSPSVTHWELFPREEEHPFHLSYLPPVVEETEAVEGVNCPRSS